MPYLKVASLRVELSNKESEFEEKNYIWKSKLHWGSGKKATLTEQNNSTFIEEIESYDNFNKFDKELDKFYNDKLWSPEEMQMKFCLLSNSKHLNPDELLEGIKEILNKIYPEKQYNGALIENGEQLKINKTEIPVRIIMAFYALNKAVEMLK